MLRADRRARYEEGWDNCRPGVCSLGEAAGAISIANGVMGLVGGGGGSSTAAAPVQASGVSTDVANRVANQSADQSASLFDYYKSNYQPLETGLTTNVQTIGTPADQENVAGQAGATVQQTYANAEKAQKLALDQAGVKPDSGNAQEIARENAVSEAGAEAGAMNTARLAERNFGVNAQLQDANIGKGLPAGAVSADAASGQAAGTAIRGASTTQAMQNTQNANIGNALTSITDGLQSVVGNSGNNSGPSSATLDQMQANVNSDFVDSGAYNSPNTSYRKGGLVKPPRREIRPHPSDGYLKGGRVHGPGTGTSDSIPVSIAGRPGAIAHGEYVLNAKAVKKIGLARLDRMNLKGLPKGAKMERGAHVLPAWSEGAQLPAPMRRGPTARPRYLERLAA